MRRVPFAVAGLAALALAAPATAAGPTHSFSGSCSFAGPITPIPPITGAPQPDPRFDLHATGTCAGTVDGAPAPAAPLVVEFVHASTPFDTCELGLDLGLRGTLALTTPAGAVMQTPITVNMLRPAVLAPMQITADDGGGGAGIAQFVPDDTAQALQACAPGGEGLKHATLKGQFQTSAPLVGHEQPAPGPGTRAATTTKAAGARHRRTTHRKHRQHARRHHRRRRR